ncbi:hypothetical protein BLNAU_10475 [Blattamonas nauphoetae]|uniref:Uncharacterized protein n=1 Tax=Blattamonas nauphoetae TaxID=2049346 RepID=A0ABQ9XST9_9EUKA|nr:hypothetical protein BLNAU_10475 [Blattamonas nauphoetae]
MVTSSITTTRQLFSIARPKHNSCRWPAEKLLPPSATRESSPCGRPATISHISIISNTSQIGSSDARLFVRLRVQLNKSEQNEQKRRLPRSCPPTHPNRLPFRDVEVHTLPLRALMLPEERGTSLFRNEKQANQTMEMLLPSLVSVCSVLAPLLKTVDCFPLVRLVLSFCGCKKCVRISPDSLEDISQAQALPKLICICVFQVGYHQELYHVPFVAV